MRAALGLGLIFIGLLAGSVGYAAGMAGVLYGSVVVVLVGGFVGMSDPDVN